MSNHHDSIFSRPLKECLSTSARKTPWLVLIAVSMALLLSGCNDSQSSGNTSGEPPQRFTPESRNVSSAVIYDAESRPLNNADVGILPATEPLTLATSAIQPLSSNANSGTPDASDFNNEDKVQTDENGILITDLAPGVYYLLSEKNGGSTITTITVQNNNSSDSTGVASALSCDDNACSDISESAIIGSISGVVYSQMGPVSGAEVSLSGGVATNGQFVSATSDSDGRYSLVYNLNRTDAIIEALKDATLRVTASGYNTLTRTLAIDSGSTSGENIALSFMTGSTGLSQEVLWQDAIDAESLQHWTISNTHEQTGWTALERGHNIVNSLVDTHVLLAPNDTSGGAVPDPHTGDFAFWYGNPESGNFVGDLSSSDGSPLDGGTSESSNRGSLTSGPIDLSAVAAETDISLTFRTWWEIESVNPNENGFDLMSVQVSTDGSNFNTIARLNPLSDPQSNVNRAPIPFSNTGFNSAPNWSSQELIPLDSIAGESTAYLRFEFRTVDGLYNGFRGWMIDNVQIRNEAGTFPTFEGTDFLDFDDEFSELMLFCEEQEPLCEEDPDTAFDLFCESHDCTALEDLFEDEGFETSPLLSPKAQPLSGPEKPRFAPYPQR